MASDLKQELDKIYSDVCSAGSDMGARDAIHAAAIAALKWAYKMVPNADWDDAVDAAIAELEGDGGC